MSSTDTIDTAKTGNKVIEGNAGKVGGVSDGDVFKNVLFHCLCIIFSPLISFFVFNFWICTSLGLSDVANNIYSALASVLVLHLALGHLIYKAYFNAPETTHGFDKVDTKED